MASTLNFLRKCMIITFAAFCNLKNSESSDCTISYSVSGDINLGAIFSFYTDPNSPCVFQNNETINPRGVFFAEAMRFAIHQINENNSLLPNIKLGFRMEDDGWAENAALGHTLDFLKDHVCSNKIDNDKDNSSAVVGIVGLSRSATTIPSARLAELYTIPVISYVASSEELADKTQFPYFLRTVPPDGFQTGVIVDVVKYYQWEYIGLIHSIDSYGIHGARQLQLQFEAEGVCVAFIASLSEKPTARDLQEISNRLAEFPLATTVVMFSSGKIATQVLDQIKQNNSREITWIGADDWGYNLQGEGYGDIKKGATFTRFYSINVPSFEHYLRSLNRTDPSLSPWLSAYIADNSECETDPSCQLFEDNLSAKYISLPVIDAVYVFAHALHALLQDKCNNTGINSEEDVVACSRRTAQNIGGEELYGYLKEVQFDSYGGHFQFDSDLNPPVRYILRNEHSVDIGNWSSSGRNNVLNINHDLNLPKSRCVQKCEPGEIAVPLEKKCCFGCQKCKDNNYIVVNDTCEECPDGFWPDIDYSNCVPIKPSNIDWSHGIVEFIIVASVLGLLLSGTIIVIMVIYREKKIIKASSRELSAINFAGIILSFFTPFILLLPPTKRSCITVETLIAISFTLTYAATLLKVNRIFRIFSATKMKVLRLKLIKPRDQVAIAGVLVLILILIIVIGSSVAPAKPVLLVPNTSEFYAEYYCQFYYGFLATCIYNAILVCFCCYYAFRARRVPDNYNESKFIGISVYSNLVICLCIVPVYSVSKSALYRVAAVCLALVVNAYLHIICVYAPKIYAARYVSDAATKSQRQSWGVSTTVAEISTNVGYSTTGTYPGRNHGDGASHQAQENIENPPHSFDTSHVTRSDVTPGKSGTM